MAIQFSPEEILETIRMVQLENLDIRTITMGISVRNCEDSSLEAAARESYEKMCRSAERLVASASRSSASTAFRSCTRARRPAMRRGRRRQRPRRRRERRRSGAAHRLRRSRERHQAAWITWGIDMPFARASAELVYLSQTKDFAGTARGRDDHLGTHGVSSRALSDERSSATASTNPLSLSSTIWTSAVRTLPSACKTSRSRRAVTRCR
jgi:hypothetical protein